MSTSLKKRSLFVSFLLTFVLAISISSVAFADESTDASAVRAGETKVGSLTVETFDVSNPGDPRGQKMDLGDRLNVRVKGASSANIEWKSLNPDMLKVQSGKNAGLANDSECTITAIGPGSGLIVVSCGEDSLEIRINVYKADINSGYAWSVNACTYTGSPLKPGVNIVGKIITTTPGGIQQSHGKLKEGRDYTVEYSNNTNAGSGTVVVKGKGNYAGTRTLSFKIMPKVLPQPVLNSSIFVYNGKAHTPSISVKDGTKVLVNGKDYFVKYSNNINAGKATVTVTGKGNYTGSKNLSFEIRNSTSNSESNGTVPDSTIKGSGATSVKPQIPSSPQPPTVTGVWKKTHGKWWFSYDAKTVKAQKNKKWPANEWVTIKGKRYHFNSAGYMNSGWYKSGKIWYYFGSDGAMKTGWQKVKGKWYYLASDGVMQTGKKAIDGCVYYLNRSSGAMKVGWNKEGSSWFYYMKSGAMKIGWQKVKGKWYYLNPKDGKMKTGFYDVAGKRYYSNGSGVMQTGWKHLSGKWYNFNKSGAMQKSKWISGKYWVDANGVMATSAWVDGDRYYVDRSGKWVKGKKR